MIFALNVSRSISQILPRDVPVEEEEKNKFKQRKMVSMRNEQEEGGEEGVKKREKK